MIIGGFFFTIAVILMMIYVFSAMLTIDTERKLGSGLIKAAAVCGILGLIFSFVEIVLLWVRAKNKSLCMQSGNMWK